MKVQTKEIYEAVQYKHFAPPECVVELREVSIQGGKESVRVVGAKTRECQIGIQDGDWIIFGKNGHIEIYSDSAFHEKFREIHYYKGDANAA